MKTRKTKAMKLLDARIERAVSRATSGVQIRVLDIPRVFKLAENMVAGGADDTLLDASLLNFVTMIRQN